MEVESQGLDSSSGMSDSDMDSLLSSETPSRDIPMESPKAQPTPQEYSFKANGKEVKAPIEKILEWATMGYNAPQKMQEFNQMKARVDEWNKKQQELEEREKKWTPYKEVDEYAAKNPDWWQQVQESYKQKIAGAQTNPEVAELKAELAELKQFRDEIKNEKQSLKAQEEDKALGAEVESIRKSYPNLDFDSPDESGKSLEMKVLEHAMENNISSFRVAFRDYYHDHLVGLAQEKGKELVSKEVQKRSKLGILSESKKPTQGLKSAENTRNKTYEQLAREALEELGIA